MANTALTSVQFNGTSLFVTIINSVPFVVLRQICEALGLDIDAQLKRIKRHPALSSTTVITTVVAEDGKHREMVMLPLDKLNGWLFGVSVRRVKPELRARLTQYQAECFDVLASHFSAKPPVSVQPEQKPAASINVDTLNALIQGGLIDHGALMALADAATQKLFEDATNNPNKGYGQEVTSKINRSMSWSDLHAINVAASMEVWMRTFGRRRGLTRTDGEHLQGTSV